jgi:ABC-type dipeptide/oligopeptide/nickel transport system permease subunit
MSTPTANFERFTPVYERVPQFWLLLGILFMASGTYLGFDFELSFLYFGVGFICWVWSFRIFITRLRSPKAPDYIQAQAQAPAESTEQPEQPEQHSTRDSQQGFEPYA